MTAEGRQREAARALSPGPDARDLCRLPTAQGPTLATMPHTNVVVAVATARHELELETRRVQSEEEEAREAAEAAKLTPPSEAASAAESTTDAAAADSKVTPDRLRH